MLLSSVCHFCISEVLQSHVQVISSSFYFGHKLKLTTAKVYLLNLHYESKPSTLIDHQCPPVYSRYFVSSNSLSQAHCLL